jgi:hypothetical protein
VSGAGCWTGNAGHDASCITCGDAAAWLRVLEVDAADGTARCVDEEGREETVATELVGAVSPDDALLVHAGAAIHREAGTATVRGRGT